MQDSAASCCRQALSGVSARDEIEIPMPQRGVAHFRRILVEGVDRELHSGLCDAGSGRDAMKRTDRVFPLRGITMQGPHDRLEL
jgi:hypothetical protein